jgi:hypothetical protein
MSIQPALWTPGTSSRDSAVGIATGYVLDGRRGQSSSPGRRKIFLFSTSPRPVLGLTQLPIQWVPEVKRSGREAAHLPLTRANITKTWVYTSTPSYVFMVQYSIS